VRGACFGELAGWERPNWFAPGPGEAKYEYSYGRQNWFDHSAAEHRAVRESVGLFDQSSFAKFILEGADSENVLNRICANNVSVPVGRIVYTQWLNERGGIEADLTITRESETRFLIVTAAATQVRDFAWLKRNIPDGSRAIAVDISSAYGVLGVMGPNSRKLLSRLTNADLSNHAFPFATSQIIDLAYAKVRASRITYVGELGWELYVPTDFIQGVFDALVAEGEAYDLRLAGYHAMNSLRMEKGYRHWGHDITDEDTPLEAGLGFAVSMKKPDGFIGRDALLRQKDAGLRRRLVHVALNDPLPLLYHNEPMWLDGNLVGRITSGMFGHTVGKSLGMGYVENPHGIVDAAFLNSGRFEVEVGGERIAAQATLRPFYDPTNSRVKDAGTTASVSATAS
jgi:4-methylaminobutanoate oxidase (formaldehyde-forming)